MTAAERRRLLGDDVIADIHRQVAEAPAPTPEVLAALRRILARPALKSSVQLAARSQRAA